MPFPVEIRTVRLCIRDFTPLDVDDLQQITGDAEVVRHLAFAATSQAEAKALVDYALVSAKVEPRQDYVLAVDDANGRMIGSCGFHEVEGARDEREVYFVLRQDTWGEGLGRELLTTLIGFGFRELGLRRIFGVAHPDNIASMRVMERAGMTFDGDVPDAFEDENGWRAGRRYAILRP